MHAILFGSLVCREEIALGGFRMTVSRRWACLFAVLAAVAMLVTSSLAQEPASTQKGPSKGKNHARPDEMLTGMIQQFHQEAYPPFISQPGAGMSRMIPTVQLVKREWKVPAWTSEELAKEQKSVLEKDL